MTKERATPDEMRAVERLLDANRLRIARAKADGSTQLVSVLERMHDQWMIMLAEMRMEYHPQELRDMGMI